MHVNSTRMEGGAAETLTKLVSIKRELGIDVRWKVISGEGEFYTSTKSFHNGLQGTAIDIPDSLLQVYEQSLERNAESLRPALEEADFVFIHDPQPARLLQLCPDRKGTWTWRCHIDLNRPYRRMWIYVQSMVEGYDASIFSLPAFARSLPHTQYLIPPSIDSLSEKNLDLDAKEVLSVQRRFGLDPERPLILQVSRFDHFKDPLGVIQAFRKTCEFTPTLQLVLAGGGASDDPEGEAVLGEVRTAAGESPDIHILLLPPDAHRVINALQRAAEIVLQKSIKEYFGLTVTEGMWTSKPVIGGNCGGTRMQVIDHHTGFLVDTPEGAAMRVRALLQDRGKLEASGRQAKEFVRGSFLITRHLRDYLTLMVAQTRGGDEDRIELGKLDA